MAAPPPTSYAAGYVGGVIGAPGTAPRPPAGPPAMPPDLEKHTTVFIGNLTHAVPDPVLQSLFATCGYIAKWNRAMGTNGQLQTFAYCTYSNPDELLRALRLLDGSTVGEKEIMLKVDDATQEFIAKYIASKRAVNKEVDEKGLTDSIRRDDEHKRQVIDGLLTRIAGDFAAPIRLAKAEKQRQSDNAAREPKERPAAPAAPAAPAPASRRNHEDLLEGEDEGVINSVRAFREAAERNEKARLQRLEQLEQRERMERGGASGGPSRDRDMPARRESNDRRSSHDRRGSHDRPARDSPPRGRETSVDRDGPSRPAGFRRDPSPGSRREPETKILSLEDAIREAEALELARADKENERMLRLFQDRERALVKLEEKKVDSYKRELEREAERVAERAIIAKKQRDFEHTYHDEEDDSRYFSSRQLSKLRAMRYNEKVEDDRDRIDEERELEDEARRAGEAARHAQEDAEAATRRNMVIEDASAVLESERREKEEQEAENKGRAEGEAARHAQEQAEEATRRNVVVEPTAAPPAAPQAETEAESSTGASAAAAAGEAAGSAKRAASARRAKSAEAAAFFQGDADEEGAGDDVGGGKRAKIVPLQQYTDEQLRAAGLDPATERRRKQEEITAAIPLDRGELFDYAVAWDQVDVALVESRVRPWVGKKVEEVFGEEEPMLVNFVCDKVREHAPPGAVVESIREVLEDDADPFVVKLWRFLIYETEAKKYGLPAQ